MMFAQSVSDTKSLDRTLEETLLPQKAACDLCGITYSSEKGLREHTLSLIHHIKLEQENSNCVHQCPVCQTSFDSVAKYGKHLRSEEHIKRAEGWDGGTSSTLSASLKTRSDRTESPGRSNSLSAHTDRESLRNSYRESQDQIIPDTSTPAEDHSTPVTEQPNTMPKQKKYRQENSQYTRPRPWLNQQQNQYDFNHRPQGRPMQHDRPWDWYSNSQGPNNCGRYENYGYQQEMPWQKFPGSPWPLLGIPVDNRNGWYGNGSPMQRPQMDSPFWGGNYDNMPNWQSFEDGPSESHPEADAAAIEESKSQDKHDDKTTDKPTNDLEKSDKASAAVRDKLSEIILGGSETNKLSPVADKNHRLERNNTKHGDKGFDSKSRIRRNSLNSSISSNFDFKSSTRSELSGSASGRGQKHNNTRPSSASSLSSSVRFNTRSAAERQQQIDNDRGAFLLSRAENLCKEFRERRAGAKLEKQREEELKKSQQHESLDKQLQSLTNMSMSRVKGKLTPENMRAAASAVQQTKPVNPDDVTSSTAGHNTDSLGDIGKMATLPPSLQREMKKRTPKSTDAQKSGSVKTERTELTQKDLMKLVKTPHSRKNQYLLTRLLRQQSQKSRFNRPRMNMQSNDSSDLHIDDLPSDVQEQIATLLQQEDFDAEIVKMLNDENMLEGMLIDLTDDDFNMQEVSDITKTENVLPDTTTNRSPVSQPSSVSFASSSSPLATNQDMSPQSYRSPGLSLMANECSSSTRDGATAIEHPGFPRVESSSGSPRREVSSSTAHASIKNKPPSPVQGPSTRSPSNIQQRPVLSNGASSSFTIRDSSPARTSSANKGEHSLSRQSVSASPGHPSPSRFEKVNNVLHNLGQIQMLLDQPLKVDREEQFVSKVMSSIKSVTREGHKSPQKKQVKAASPSNSGTVNDLVSSLSNEIKQEMKAELQVGTVGHPQRLPGESVHRDLGSAVSSTHSSLPLSLTDLNGPLIVDPYRDFNTQDMVNLQGVNPPTQNTNDLMSSDMSASINTLTDYPGVINIVPISTAEEEAAPPITQAPVVMATNTTMDIPMETMQTIVVTPDPDRLATQTDLFKEPFCPGSPASSKRRHILKEQHKEELSDVNELVDNGQDVKRPKFDGYAGQSSEDDRSSLTSMDKIYHITMLEEQVRQQMQENDAAIERLEEMAVSIQRQLEQQRALRLKLKEEEEDLHQKRLAIVKGAVAEQRSRLSSDSDSRRYDPSYDQGSQVRRAAQFRGSREDLGSLSNTEAGPSDMYPVRLNSPMMSDQMAESQTSEESKLDSLSVSLEKVSGSGSANGSSAEELPKQARTETEYTPRNGVSSEPAHGSGGSSNGSDRMDKTLTGSQGSTESGAEGKGQCSSQKGRLSSGEAAKSPKAQKTNSGSDVNTSNSSVDTIVSSPRAKGVSKVKSKQRKSRWDVKTVQSDSDAHKSDVSLGAKIKALSTSHKHISTSDSAGVQYHKPDSSQQSNKPKKVSQYYPDPDSNAKRKRKPRSERNLLRAQVAALAVSQSSDDGAGKKKKDRRYRGQPKEIPAGLREYLHGSSSSDVDLDASEAAASHHSGGSKSADSNRMEFSGSHGGAVTAMLAHQDSLFTASEDQTIKQWNLKSGACTRTIKPKQESVTALAVVSLKKFNDVIVSGGKDGSLSINVIESGNHVTKLKQKHPVSCLSTLWQSLYVGMDSGDISVYNRKLHQVSYYSSAKKAISCIARFNSDKTRLVLEGSHDGSIKVRNAETASLIGTLEGHTKAPLFMKVVGNDLYSAGSGKHLMIHNIRKCQMVKMVVLVCPVIYMGFVDKSMVMLGTDKCIRCYDPKGKKWGQVMAPLDGTIGATAITGNKLYYATGTGSICCVDIQKKENIKCEYGRCGMVCGGRDHLGHHVLEKHVFGGSVVHTCVWKDCRHSFKLNDNQKPAHQAVADHLLQHVSETHPF